MLVDGVSPPPTAGFGWRDKGSSFRHLHSNGAPSERPNLGVRKLVVGPVLAWVSLSRRPSRHTVSFIRASIQFILVCTRQNQTYMSSMWESVASNRDVIPRKRMHFFLFTFL